jgi:hypothetical protein
MAELRPFTDFCERMVRLCMSLLIDSVLGCILYRFKALDSLVVIDEFASKGVQMPIHGWRRDRLILPNSARFGIFFGIVSEIDGVLENVAFGRSWAVRIIRKQTRRPFLMGRQERLMGDSCDALSMLMS